MTFSFENDPFQHIAQRSTSYLCERPDNEHSSYRMPVRPCTTNIHSLTVPTISRLQEIKKNRLLFGSATRLSLGLHDPYFTAKLGPESTFRSHSAHMRGQRREQRAGIERTKSVNNSCSLMGLAGYGGEDGGSADLDRQLPLHSLTHPAL
jgi:hypothetical protein